MQHKDNINKGLKSFHFAFEISRSIVFEISYYRCGRNKDKYFSTCGAVFNKPKTDFNQCGQCQDSILKSANTANVFYLDFDKLHLSDLTSEQHSNILDRIEELKKKYNWAQTDREDGFNFKELKTLSKTPIKSNKIEVKL